MSEPPIHNQPAAPSIVTRFGVLEVVLAHSDQGVSARLARPHPRLTAIAGAVGQYEDEALERLRDAVERFGSGWPRPPRMQVFEQTDQPYRPADVVVQVLVQLEDGTERDGWAVGWRGQEVWICWQEAGLDGTAWVPATAVRRAE